MTEWIKCSEDISINTNYLITDGLDVSVGFFDSYHNWRFANQDICDEQEFNVTHYMEFPERQMTRPELKQMLFEEWSEQEIFGDLMLQYELKNVVDIINIPFRIVEWCASDCSDELWKEQITEIEVVMTGDIIFEGVRHCNFAEQDYGYINYPAIKQLSECLNRVHELCLQYCTDYS